MINSRDVANKEFKWFMAAWVLCFTLGLAMVAGIVYVLIHFVSKFW